MTGLLTSTTTTKGGREMITLIGKCMNCGKIYGSKVIGTLESIYSEERTHVCEREGK